MSLTKYNNISQLITLKNAFHKDGRLLKPSDLSIIEDGTIVFDDKQIHWVGKTKNTPIQYKNTPSISMLEKTVTPEIIDSHTHLVFAGNRSNEYSMRLNGADYEEIAIAGGGILSTMEATKNASKSELFETAKLRINEIHSYGVGTIEIKSGYGLTFEKEEEISLIINDLKKHFFPNVQIINTYMAAHAIPKTFSSSKDYMNEVVLPLLEKLSTMKIIDCVDIFYEKNYFDKNDVLSLSDKANQYNLKLKIHGDEFNDNSGGSLAAKLNAVSVDHLLKVSDKSIYELSQSKTVATLLPGTGYFLGKEQCNARKLLDAGVKVSIASDYNPGSCHFNNVLFLATLAAPNYKMNICEMWAAITLNAAHSLGLKNQGALITGQASRFSIFDSKNIENINYFWGKNFNSSL